MFFAYVLGIGGLIVGALILIAGVILGFILGSTDIFWVMLGIGGIVGVMSVAVMFFWAVLPSLFRA